MYEVIKDGNIKEKLKSVQLTRSFSSKSFSSHFSQMDAIDKEILTEINDYLLNKMNYDEKNKNGKSLSLIINLIMLKMYILKV